MIYSSGPLPPVVYVSGPMTGYEDFNYGAFFSAEERLRAKGFTVINPARFGGAEQTGLSYPELIKRDIRVLLSCTGVALLPGWSQSRGASVEHDVARACGLDVFPLDTWLNMGQPSAN